MPESRSVATMTGRTELEKRGEEAAIRKFGKEHTVTGKITETGENCSLSELAGSQLRLKQYYYLHDGHHWRIPPLQPSPWVFHHVPLVGTGNKELEQGETMATATVADDGSFTLNWNEVIQPDRSPFMRVRPLSPDYADPDDPMGFKEVDAMRVFKLGQSLTPTGMFLWLTPEIELTFWGEETSKSLPPLHADCFPIEG